MSKYRNVKTTVGGITFDSKKEAKRYQELKLLEKQGLIRDLRVKPVFYFSINSVMLAIATRKSNVGRSVTYTADFDYYEIRNKEWVYVCEDVKGMKTPVYKLKKALMKLFHNIEVREI